MKGLIIIMIFGILAALASFAQQLSCDYKVEILVNGSEFYKDNFEWRMKATKIEGASANLTGTASILLNGKAVKTYKPWNHEPISRQKTSNKYSPNLYAGIYNLTAEIGVDCFDTNLYNNFDSKIIEIKSNSNYSKKIEISKINESGSEAQTANLTQSEANKKALIDYTENVIQTREEKSSEKEKPPTTNAVAIPKTVYESSSEKAKSLTIISLLLVSVIINIVLIWKR